MAGKEKPAGKPDKGRLGPFTLVRLLGKGGMGAVYQARRDEADASFAIKVLLPSMAGDEEILERFKREIQAGQKLDHPGIVKVHEVGFDKGKHYFAMDFVDGRSLENIIDREGLPPEKAAAVIREAAEALHHAHENGVTHRDIKPGNIILSADGHVYITDFGIAREASAAALTADGQVVGTPFYMSPEQALGKREAIGPVSDVYSLGITFYELLTRTTPFRGENIHQIFSKILRQDPVPPSSLAPEVPRPLEMIVMKAIRKEAHKRYPTMLDLAEDIDRFLEGDAVRAKPLSTAERVTRAVKQHKGLSVTGAAATLLVVVFIGILVAGARAARLAEREKAQQKRAKVERLLAEGRGAYDSGAFTKARDAFTKVLAEDPDNEKAAHGKASAMEAENKRLRRLAKAEQQKKAAALVAEAEAKQKAFVKAHLQRIAALEDLDILLDTYGRHYESSEINRKRAAFEKAQARAEDAASKALDLYHRALLLDPPCVEAHQGIAAIRMDSCEAALKEALEAGAFGDVKRLLLLVKQHDLEDRHAERIEAIRKAMAWKITVYVSADPPADEVRLFRADLVEGRPQEVKPVAAGRFQVPPGSYVVEMEKRGYVKTRRPFTVARPALGKPPPDRKTMSVALVRDAAKYEGMVYIPAGPFVMGGDEGVRAGPRRTRELEAFFIDRTEVTCAAYEIFLDRIHGEQPELVEAFRPKFPIEIKSEKEREDWKKAWKRLERPDPFREVNAYIAWIREPDGRYSPRDVFRDFPVTGVTFEAAKAYARACGKRLPTSEEWEKASRGVDGRKYPWGTRFDENLAATQKVPDPSAREWNGWIYIFPADSLHEGQSPYGVLHMAGNVAEWTATPFKGDHYINRGGSAYDTPQMMRCASLDYTRPADNNSSLGFRCVRDAGE